MTALIELLESATEGSRELDVEIVFALYPESIYQPQCVGEEPIFWSEPYYKQECPAFTTSIDAALTLVPDGRIWTLGTYADHSGYRAALDSQSESTKAATPALALCIAALKARAA